ncbi:MAG: DUF1295 domain-containing protein [Longimicrobiales bacterium]|nr:DUF1295 domain-containing protein [Longimicrobiales bacterium]
MPGWAGALHRIASRAIGEGRNRGPFPLNAVIDVHKGSTGVFVLVLMQAYDVFTPSAYVYLALHGTYGIAWVIKDLTVGDRRWRHRVGVPGALGTWAFLSLYWVAPVVLILGQAGELDLAGWTPAGPMQLAAAVVAYVVGLVLMIGADAQKNTLLARRENAGAGDAGLITTGFYARVRHPNYLGEILIYGGFALVVDHWIPWAILVPVWVLFFLPNMLAIDASLSRYPGFEEWRERTGFLLPRPGRRSSAGDG